MTIPPPCSATLTSPHSPPRPPAAALATSLLPTDTPQAPHAERPRERLQRAGAASLSDAELLAIVLGTGMRGRPVLELSQDLLRHRGGLRGLLGASLDTLSLLPGLGPARACHLVAILELARRTQAETLRRETVLNQPQAVRQYCAMLLGCHTVEVCMALYLDHQLQLIATEEISRGTLSQAAVYPREVVRGALRHHAAALILTHNHPSGRAEPSSADRQLTRTLRDALALVDVRLVDHIIVAAQHTVSFAELGLLDTAR